MKHIMIMLGICFAMVIGYQQTTPAMESHSVQEITVKSGDTLWDIASRSTASNVDVREVVHTVKELNNISDSGKLTPGTKIKFQYINLIVLHELWTIWLKIKYI